MNFKPNYLPPPRDKLFWCTTILYLFNLIVFLSSIAFLGIAAWILATTAYLTALLSLDQNYTIPSLLQQSAFVLLFSGFVLLIVSIFGISAVYTEQTFMIRIYTGTICFIILLEFIIAVVVTIFRNRIKKKLKHSLYQYLDSEYDGYHNTTNRFSLSMDWLMVTYECCGIEGYKDFQKSATHWRTLHDHLIIQPVVPITCCRLVDKSVYPTALAKLKFIDRRCPVYPTKENSWRERGCFETLIQLTYGYISVIIGLGTSLLILQIFGAVLSIVLVTFLKQRQQLYVNTGKENLGLPASRVNKPAYGKDTRCSDMKHVMATPSALLHDTVIPTADCYRRKSGGGSIHNIENPHQGTPMNNNG